MRLKLILQLKIYSCASLLIYKMKFIFCLAYWNFFEKCYLVVWCDGVWCGGMVRPPRLVSYACLYTHGKNRYSLSPDFVQVTPDIKLSGNLDLNLFPQISAGKFRSYAFWKFR